MIDDPAGNTFYAYPSLAVNRNGEMLVTFASFSASRFASADYVFVNAAGVASTPGRIKAGEAAIFETTRWGDYTTTVVDPRNDRDFWGIQMYATSANTWGTWWAQVTRPGKRRSVR